MSYGAGSLKGGRCNLALQLVSRSFVVPDRNKACPMERVQSLSGVWPAPGTITCTGFGMKEATSLPHLPFDPVASASPENEDGRRVQPEWLEVVVRQLCFRPTLAGCHLVAHAPGAEKASARGGLDLFGSNAADEFIAGDGVMQAHVSAADVGASFRARRHLRGMRRAESWLISTV
jgi:hypothetical protein